LKEKYSEDEIFDLEDLSRKYYPGLMAAIAKGIGYSPKSQLINAIDMLTRAVSLLEEFIFWVKIKSHKLEFIPLYSQLISLHEILGDYSGVVYLYG